VHILLRPTDKALLRFELVSIATYTLKTHFGMLGMPGLSGTCGDLSGLSGAAGRTEGRLGREGAGGPAEL